MTAPNDRRALADRLRAQGLPEAETEARWLLADCGHDPGVLAAAVTRRLAGVPLSRVLGRRGFWTLDLAVTPATLDPRADTEAVVRLALRQLTARGGPDRPWRILDLGTGTGAILLAVLSACPAATGLGTDRSPEALAVARQNARAHGLLPRAAFAAMDWAAALRARFDLVVANPPYIPTGMIPTLDPAVRDHDPWSALDGGVDGLDAYRRILPAVQELLLPGGALVLEIGAGQEADVLGIAHDAGLARVDGEHDLGGHLRALAFACR